MESRNRRVLSQNDLYEIEGEFTTYAICVEDGEPGPVSVAVHITPPPGNPISELPVRDVVYIVNAVSADNSLVTGIHGNENIWINGLYPTWIDNRYTLDHERFFTFFRERYSGALEGCELTLWSSGCDQDGDEMGRIHPFYWFSDIEMPELGNGEVRNGSDEPFAWP